MKWKVSAFTHIYTKDCYPSNNENNEWFPLQGLRGSGESVAAAHSEINPGILLHRKTRVYTEERHGGGGKSSSNRREPTAKYKRDDGVRNSSFAIITGIIDSKNIHECKD